MRQLHLLYLCSPSARCQSLKRQNFLCHCGLHCLPHTVMTLARLLGLAEALSFGGSGRSGGGSDGAAINTHSFPGNYPHGLHWAHCNVSPHAELKTDPQMSMISPWCTIQHKLSTTLNHPLQLGELCVDKEMHVTCFINQRCNPSKHCKSFMSRFPTLCASDSKVSAVTNPILLPGLPALLWLCCLCSASTCSPCRKQH